MCIILLCDIVCIVALCCVLLLVPGPVRNLSSEILAPSQRVRISWVAPAVTNGDIVSYEVTYGVLGEGMSDQSKNVDDVIIQSLCNTLLITKYCAFFRS